MKHILLDKEHTIQPELQTSCKEFKKKKGPIFKIDV
jgi:hypothetical protein